MVQHRPTEKPRYGTIQWWGLLVILLCGYGCGQPQGELFPEQDNPIVWPAPPEKPRIKFLGQLSTENDLRRAISSMEKFRQTLFGRENIGVLAGPYALALDKQKRLFISDTAGAVVHLMDLETREYRQFFQVGSAEKLMVPVGLTLADEFLYVSDSGRKEICVFDLEGNYQFSFGKNRLQRPADIAFNQINQNLYVSDASQHAIFIFNKEGAYLDKIGSRGEGSGQFNFPTHLWVDLTGKLYVSDTLNYRVQIFSPDGKFLKMFGRQGDRPGYFAHPCGLATDSFGNIYVADKQYENIQIFDDQGRILMAFGGEGSGPGMFWLPAGLFIDSDNRIYIADSFNKRIQILQLLEVEKP